MKSDDKKKIFASDQFQELAKEEIEKKQIEKLHEYEKVQKKEETKRSEKIKSEKNLFITIGLIILIFAVFFIGYRFFFGKTEILSIDDLHNLNLAGELEEDQGYLYNGFSFVKSDGMWFTRFKRAASEQPYNVQLRFGAKDVENVPLVGDYLYLLNFNSTYVTFDPLGQDLSYVALAAADISSNLAAVLERSSVAACTKNETPACKIRPIINCDSGFPTIFIKEDNETKVEATGTCITIQGQGTDLVKAVDRLLLGWYGVMS